MSLSTVLIAHPSPDLYGSDLQLLESVSALTSKDFHVVVVLPQAGPLVAQLESRGAAVKITSFPVLRRSVMTPSGLPRFAIQFTISLFAIFRCLATIKPSVVYINTVTIPQWALVASIRRIPRLCHVHEAISDFPKPVRTVLAGQLRLCTVVVVNSSASSQAIINEVSSIEAKLRTIYNGVPGPDSKPAYAASWHAQQRPISTALIGRISPRKGTDVAISALRLVRAKGFDVTLTICGAVFPGYEWYESQLRSFVREHDLEDSVVFSGYVNPTRPVLIDSDIVLVPSRLEPFGNTAVEAQLAGRPLIASKVQGLMEIVHHGRNGLQAAPGDEHDLARKIIQLIESPVIAEELASAGWESANARFGVARYHEEILMEIMRLEGTKKVGNPSSKGAHVLRTKLSKVKYLLKLPEIKRNTLSLFANKVSNLPGFPQRIRLLAARATGVQIGNSRIGAYVRFSNDNVVIGDRCRIGRSVRFEGIGRISIGDDVSIGNHATLTTRRRLGGGSGQLCCDAMLLVDNGTVIGPGGRTSPVSLRESCDAHSAKGQDAC